MTTVNPTSSTSEPMQSVRPFVRLLEVIALGGLGVTAWIHLTEMSGKFSEVPYLGVGYAILVVACLAAAVGVVRGDRRGWMLAGLATAAAIAGFTLTRTTGLPGSMDDIGNWSEKIAVYSLLAEGVVVAASAFVLRGGHHRS
jgi:hypothetical protein